MSHASCIATGIKSLAVALALITGASGPAGAAHDPDIIHACIKKGKIKIVRFAGQCRPGASHFALATEAALSDLQDENAALQARLDLLETQAKRLHGYTAAIIERSTSGTSQGMPGGYVVRMSFCALDDFLNAGACDASSGIVLESDLITEADDNTAITFDASNVADFPAIVELLTNGENDVVKVETEYRNGDGSFGGSGSSQASERSWFFQQTQTTSGIGFTDLVGLEIGSISISVDFISIFFDPNTQTTSLSLDYRVFFSIAP